jgi:hypothetical protein
MTTTLTTRLTRTAATIATAALTIAALGAVTTETGASASPATQIARQLLNEAVLPPSAVLAHPSTVVVCQCEGALSGSPVTSLHHFYIVTGSPQKIESFLSTHVPAGGTYGGDGTTQTRGAAEIFSTAITFAANGPHLYLKQLAYSMVQRNASTSWLRVDSQIVWIPNRSSSEKITGVVSATATGYTTTSLMGSHGAVRVNLSATQLSNFVRAINGLPLGPQDVCMENVTAFTVMLRLKNGDELRVFNGDCSGSYDSVSLMSGATATKTYVLSDRACGLIADVSALFGADEAQGTHQALRYCEAAK